MSDSALFRRTGSAPFGSIHVSSFKVLLCLAALALSHATPLWASDTPLVTIEGQRRILGPPVSPTVGSASPSVTVVEYFDYNCPYCKRLSTVLQALVDSDPTVAVVYKDWPILGEVSVYAARCALAARWQDRYAPAHDALIGGPRLSVNSQVDAELQRAGIDMIRLKADLERHAGTIDALLAHIDDEARALTLPGTPGLLVGRQLVPGDADLSDLKSFVANSHGP